MGKHQAYTTDNSFFCMRCGNKGIPLARRESSRREAHHRKKLYCRFCKEEVNHIECRTLDEIELFKENFKNGVYIDEAEASVAYVRNSRVGQVYLGKAQG